MYFSKSRAEKNGRFQDRKYQQCWKSTKERTDKRITYKYITLLEQSMYRYVGNHLLPSNIMIINTVTTRHF